MDMIGHLAKGMDAMAVLFDSFLQQQIKAAAILVTKENILAGIASHDHMVQGRRVVDSWFSCHRENLPG